MSTSQRTNERVAAVGLGMASLGSSGPSTWEPNWIDYRHSVVLVDKRRDLGEVPATCDACGCETDITPAPHSPKCPTLARDEWTREPMLQAVETWASGHDGEAPAASDWSQETRSHPSARQVIVEFGSWGNYLGEAGFGANTPRRRGRRLGAPAPLDGRELLDRMDAGEPVSDEPEPGDDDAELEETAAVGKRADLGAALLLVGEPERAAASSSPRRRGGPAAKWTREKIVAAIREVGEKVGRTPSGADMRAHGLGGAYQVSSFTRLGVTWAELVVEAGYEPRQRGDNGKSSGREPSAAKRDGVEAAADDATVTGDEENLALTLRDPIQTAEIPYDADVLEDEAEFLRSRAAALEQIAGGIRELARLSTRETAA